MVATRSQSRKREEQENNAAGAGSSRSNAGATAQTVDGVKQEKKVSWRGALGLVLRFPFCLGGDVGLCAVSDGGPACCLRGLCETRAVQCEQNARDPRASRRRFLRTHADSASVVWLSLRLYNCVKWRSRAFLTQSSRVPHHTG